MTKKLSVREYLVKEWKSSDEVIIRIQAPDDVLGIMSQQLENCDHRQATVRKLLRLGILQLLGGLPLSFCVTKNEEPVVVHRADKEENLEPAKRWDGLDRRNAIRDGREGNSGRNISWKLENFGNNISDDCKLGDAAVLQFCSPVLLEGRRINIFREACKEVKNLIQENFQKMIPFELTKWIEESQGRDGSSLSLVTHLQRRRTNSTGSGCEGYGVGEDRKKSSKLEHDE